jgi:tRNA threonylcarbamoyladenosine biosynthesis protein TsaE
VNLVFGTTVTLSREETFQLGYSVGRALAEPCVFLLEGQLGSGKTVFTKGLICGLGCPDPDDVTSPSFTLINEYLLRLKVYHVDLYRLETANDLHSLDLEEIFAEPAVVIVEWAEKLRNLAPDNAIRVCIEDLGDDRREIKVQPWDRNPGG